MTWLVTGGAGYIGSHVVRELASAGHRVVVFDDLSAGEPDRIPDTVTLREGTLLDEEALVEALTAESVTGVVNIAARKSVPESVEKPLWYYQENVGGFTTLLAAMERAGIHNLVHSSSASIYGAAAGPMLVEDEPVVPLSPYAQTKLIAEHILTDTADTLKLSYVALRYFNPIGAAAPTLAEVGGTNVMAVLFDTIDAGRVFQVTGNDFDTRDGSGIRDYIHVQDLAEAHVAAVEKVTDGEYREVLNIGTGRGYTVFELLDAVRKVTGLEVPYEIVGRRPGDPAGAAASVDKATNLLGWRAKRDLLDMVDSAWRMWRAQHD